MPKYKIASASIWLASTTLCSNLALANDEDPDGTAQDIIVSAQRTPIEATRISSSISTIDQLAIERQQPVAVSDLLIRTPSVSQSRSGGYGSATSLRIRGATPSQIVLVIDGMRMADPSTIDASYNFANLLADDIARIEVLRGSQSILWGSNAIGGVVNIVTARAEKPLEGRVKIEVGSRETLNAHAALGGESDKLAWRLAGNYFTTDGISARAIGIEPDGYQRTAASGTVTTKLSNTVSLDLRGYYADGRTEFDGFFGDSFAYGFTEEWTAYAGLNFALLDGRFQNRIAVLQNSTDREDFDPARAVRKLSFDALGRTRRYEYQGVFEPFKRTQLVFGIERDEQRIQSASPADSNASYTSLEADGAIDSIYGQLRATVIGGVTLNAGTRWDHHSRFGSSNVFSAGLVWALDSGRTILRANYDEGFKAPSLYQLFSEYGLADLQPERAKGWEVALEQSLFDEQLRLSMTYFERKTDDLIDFSFCPTSGPLPIECYVPGTTMPRFGYYANIDKSHARGIEIWGSLQFGKLFANANLSWIEAEDRTPGFNLGAQLARVPHYLVNGEIGYEFASEFETSLSVRYSDKILDYVGGSVLDDHLLTDLRFRASIYQNLTLTGRIDNLLNVTHETSGGYGSLGRCFYVGLSTRF